MINNVTFVVDSGSDYETYLTSYFDYPIKVIPLHLFIDGIAYLDGVNISKTSFYKDMEHYKELPKTSQPTPLEFFQVFEEEIKIGNDVLYVGLSSKLSGTFQSAAIAKSMFPEEQQKKVHLVDSMSVSAVVLFLLLRANQLLKQDMPLVEVVEHLENYREKTKLIALLDTLENLKKGGRVSVTQAAIGGLLNIKPLISIEEGLVKNLDKFRGRKKGLRSISEFLNDPANNIAKNKIFFVHAYVDQERLKEEFKDIDLSNFKEVIYLKLGTSVGTHAGVNTVGLVYELE